MGELAQSSDKQGSKPLYYYYVVGADICVAPRNTDTPIYSAQVRFGLFHTIEDCERELSTATLKSVGDTAILDNCRLAASQVLLNGAIKRCAVQIPFHVQF